MWGRNLGCLAAPSGRAYDARSQGHKFKAHTGCRGYFPKNMRSKIKYVCIHVSIKTGKTKDRLKGSHASWNCVAHSPLYSLVAHSASCGHFNLHSILVLYCNYHKSLQFSGLKTTQIYYLIIVKLRSPNGFHWARTRGQQSLHCFWKLLRDRTWSLAFSSCPCSPQSWAQSPQPAICLRCQSSHLSLTILLPCCPCMDSCNHIGPTWIIQDPLPPQGT